MTAGPGQAGAVQHTGPTVATTAAVSQQTLKAGTPLASAAAGVSTTCRILAPVVKMMIISK